jgi:hypothetical protein
LRDQWRHDEAATAVALLAAALARRRRGAGGDVEAVQYPAWLGARRTLVPLAPGTAAGAAIGVRTGNNARVQLRLPRAAR